ncbi:MAG TPA: GntR family transcriptional regulator [Chloroflexota bacterium]|nr:GntR family transcriptional regulator [Chloroflexota bacterium]
MYKAADPLNARLAEYAYAIIRNDILAGRFGPGGRLVQDELARRLGISRTPVREAIVRLEQEGLVTLIPRRGAVVNRVTPQDILDIYEVREELERLAVRLAACKGNAYDIRTLRQILRKMERVGPTRVWEYYKLNRAFHLQMAAASANKALMSALESLWDQATNFQMFTMYSTEELRRLVAPHEYLVDVAEREDAAEIACAVSQHIAEARANLLRKLDCHQPSAVYRQPPSASHGGRAPGGVGNRD